MKQGAGNAFLKISANSVIAFIFTLTTWGHCMAQGDIAVGSWRYHLAYKNIHQLTGSDETVFALGKNSLFYFSTEELTPKTLTKLDGLYGHDFASVAYDPISKTLLIAYWDGTLDLISETHVRRINDIRTNTLITEKTIRNIRMINGSAWLSTDFGIIRVNLEEGYIESAYLNLGPNGSILPINDVAIFENMLYAVTESGVIRGELSANLNDFNQWRLLDLVDTNLFSQVVAVNDGLFFLGQDQQVYYLKSGSLDWIAGTLGVNNLKISGEKILLSMENSLYELNPNGNLEIISSNEETAFNDFHVTQTGVFVATSNEGVLQIGRNEAIYVQGPPSSLLNFSHLGDITVGFPRAAEGQQEVLVQRELGVFSLGNWNSWELPARVTAVADALGVSYIGTQHGLFRREGETVVAITDPMLGSSIEIEALAEGPAGQLYVGINTPAPHLLIGDKLAHFSPYEIDGIQGFDKIQVDRLGNCWIVDRQQGGGRLHQFNPKTGLTRTFSSAINNGSLPGQRVRDIFLDSEQNLWIATNQGIAYFFGVTGIEASSDVNAVLPIFENRIALANTITNQIQIAPDRSIWVGTENLGLWHFAPDFEKLIRNFTTQNSPLPSSQIHSLALNDKSGELFISTSSGSVSFRAESIRPMNTLKSLKIYPNPIRQDFNGVLSIESLSDFSTLKIANIAGRIVASMPVGGGKVTWNLRDPSGKRIAPGVYLVYVIDAEGIERASGKFLVH